MTPDVLDIAALVEGRPYQPFVDGDLGFLPLSRGKWTVVDAADFETASVLKWCACPSRSAHSVRWYADRRPTIDGRLTSQRLHRFLLDAASDEDVDHRNRDSLDNRRVNLRRATRSQNLCNKSQAPGLSGFVGVGLHCGGLWYARVQKDRRVYSAGYHRDPVSAARARDALALRLHGDFVRLNFPQQGIAA